MRKILMLVLGAVILSTAFAGVVLAQTTTPATTGQYPSVSNLKPFTAEANYMSLPGYLRYLVFQKTSQWLTRTETDRIVKQESGL